MVARRYAWGPRQQHTQRRKRARTEAGHEVVDDRPNSRLPSEGRVVRPNEPQHWGQTKNANVEPVEVLHEVVPRYRRQCLLVFERVGHIVIWNVGVGGGVFRVFDELCWLDGGDDLGRDGRGDGRHVWR